MSWQHEQPFHQFLSLPVTEHRQLVYLVSIAELGHFLQLWVKYVCVTMEYCCSLKPLRSLKMGLFLISTISGIGSIVVFRHSSILSPEQLFILVCESLRLLLFKRWGLNIFVQNVAWRRVWPLSLLGGQPWVHSWLASFHLFYYFVIMLKVIIKYKWTNSNNTQQPAVTGPASKSNSTSSRYSISNQYL